MTIKHEQWKKILSAIDADKNLSKDNVIGKIKEKLSQYSDEYKEWDKASFNVNHLFHAVNKPDNPFPREDDKCTLLHLAARNNLENITEALLGVEGIDVNAADRLPVWTPLHYAARFNSEKVIDILLKAEKININAESCRKCTPLHIAAHYDSGKAIDTLLKAKDIDVNVKNQDDETPLHCAAQFDHKEAISALLKAKDINVNAKNNRGKTPGDLAVDDEIKRLLRKAEEEQLSRRQNQSNLPENSADNSDNKNVILEKSTSAAKVDSSIEHTQPTSAAKKGVFAGCVTAALSTAVAVALFATGTITTGLYPVIGAVVTVVAAALAVAYTTVGMLEPSAKMDETKEAQNVNGNVPGGGKEGQGGNLT